MSELVNISIGDLWDKYTILLIKLDKVKNLEKIKHVKIELNELKDNMKKYNFEQDELFEDLKNINLKIWELEDLIRRKERDKEFDQKFIELARNTYYNNDIRCKIKLDINTKYSSKIVEIKDHVKYN